MMRFLPHAIRRLLSLLVVAVLAGCAQPQPAALTRIPATQPALAPSQPAPAAAPLTIMSWNIRGYPERISANTAWIHQQVARIQPAILCLQEIANEPDVRAFSLADARLKTFAFADSSDGMDNVIFTTADVMLQDLPDPQGFQHPAQAAFVACGGFDAVVMTVHLSWTDRARREAEMALLRTVAADLARYDPDVIVVGDFNLKEEPIDQLARDLGMTVMVPAGQEGVGTTQAGNRYDHFVISADLAQEEAIGAAIQTFTGSDQAISKKVSDHLPITASFRTDACFRDRPQ